MKAKRPTPPPTPPELTVTIQKGSILIRVQRDGLAEFEKILRGEDVVFATHHETELKPRGGMCLVTLHFPAQVLQTTSQAMPQLLALLVRMGRVECDHPDGFLRLESEGSVFRV